MTHFVLRFDDVCECMAWDRFEPFQAALDRVPAVKPLLGVVPRNRDAGLRVRADRADFWPLVRQWRSRGWTIAQHGTTHEYTTRDAGLLRINRNSEFAGLPYEQQFDKLREGKAILEAQGVWQPYFMAPSHSFDLDTLRALRELQFVAITDGWGVVPYRLAGITAVPQLFATPRHFGVGVYTIALHVNTMGPAAIERMSRFIEANADRFISFPDAAALPRPALLGSLSRVVTRSVVPLMRRTRRSAKRPTTA